MSIEIKVPVFPESVLEGTIAKWYKKPGESIKRDEHLLDIETDKVVLEIVAPEDGSLASILKKEGETVKGEEVVAQFNPGKVTETPEDIQKSESTKPEVKQEPKTESKPLEKLSSTKTENLSPSVRRVVLEKDLELQNVQGSGKGGRITKEDVLKGAELSQRKSESPEKTSSLSSSSGSKSKDMPLPAIEFPVGDRVEKRVPMSRLRARIAERLLQAQQSAAILTTFNEINMKPVMDLRQKYKETFEKVHGVRLGFMSFFTLAVVEALKRFPIINASVEGTDIVYHGYYDIGIAVASPRGLVVPVIRNAETLDMAGIEKHISEYGQKAKEGHLTIEEITGGTFTISNGGVFGSLMSTPILNPPQSAILGLHKIEERPIAENGEVVIRPMMYVAMSYDHRIIDGSESVRFLVTVKELLEDPARFLLEV